MNIIVEGPDNAGKSTLIKFLESNLRRSVIHNTVDKDSSSVLAKQTQELSLEGNTIYDRSAVISEYIYCMVLKRAPVIDINLDSIFKLAENTILIICLPSIDKVLGTTKDEMEGVKENLRELYVEYDRLVDHLSVAGHHFVIYDYEAVEKEDVLEYILKRNEANWRK